MLKGLQSNMKAERWKNVAGWSEYKVSSYGRVRRKGRKAMKGYRYKGKLITWLPAKYLDTTKRRFVDLQQGGRKKRFSVSVLVLTAFVGPRTKLKPIARHLDDNFTNNYLWNLAWGTRRDNRMDACRNGTQGSGSPWAKKVAEKLRGRPRPREVWVKIRSARKKAGNYNWTGV